MSITAIVPINKMAAANAYLEDEGFGPNNFSVPCFDEKGATHGVLHAWDDPAFTAKLKTLKANFNVDWVEGEADPASLVTALATDTNTVWGAGAPDLPTAGPVAKGDIYRYGGVLWGVIQPFDRSVFGAPPATYPALIRQLIEPYTAMPWRQPIDQYDSYQLVNAFSGLPDRCTYAGKTWATKVDNNVWPPAAGPLWEEVTP